MKLIIKFAAVLILFAGITASAEHSVGKAITGKIVDKDGKVVKTDLSKKKYVLFYYTAAW